MFLAKRRLPVPTVARPKFETHDYLEHASGFHFNLPFQIQINTSDCFVVQSFEHFPEQTYNLESKRFPFTLPNFFFHRTTGPRELSTENNNDTYERIQL